MVGLFLGSISGAYFNSVLMCFFVNLLRQNGFVLNLKKVMTLGWPVFRALLLGFMPAAIIGMFIQWLAPSLDNAVLVSIPIGVFVSAVLLHRFFLTEVSESRNWNIAIVILAVVQTSLSGFAFFLFQSSM